MLFIWQCACTIPWASVLMENKVTWSVMSSSLLALWDLRQIFSVLTWVFVMWSVCVRHLVTVIDAQNLLHISQCLDTHTHTHARESCVISAHTHSVEMMFWMCVTVAWLHFIFDLISKGLSWDSRFTQHTFTWIKGLEFKYHTQERLLQFVSQRLELHAVIFFFFFPLPIYLCVAHTPFFPLNSTTSSVYPFCAFSLEIRLNQTN